MSIPCLKFVAARLHRASLWGAIRRAIPPLVRLLGVLMLVLPVTRLADAQSLDSLIYMAGLHESQWQYQGSKYHCELKHEIPQFGTAVFSRLSGDPLKFRIDAFQTIPETVKATLHEVSPDWEHEAPDDLEQYLEIRAGLRPITLDRKPAGWLLNALSKGQLGSFDFLDWNDSRRQVSVRLSPVRFTEAYRAFKQCLSELSPNGFDAVKDLTVLFPLDVHLLDNHARQALDRVADYLQADERITAVRVAGHADDQGTSRYNMKLSARRAESVTRYLVSKGVKRNLIQSRHYGESRPAIAKRTERARAANRRVQVDLQR
ncbi:MAG: OmpA family protein [Candidatus Thiodiazotropha sp.]